MRISLLSPLCGLLLLASSAAAQDPHAQDPNAQNPHSQNPHAMMDQGMGTRQMTSLADPSLPPGVVVVKVIDSLGRPVPGVPVTALETLQSISQGNTDRRLKQTTQANGEARFSDLDTSLKNIYKISLDYAGALYEVPAFRSQEKSGHRVIVPVYEKTHDPTLARVGMRGFVYVMMHEGEFVFDVLYRVFSLGNLTWQPAGVELELPHGAEAVQPSEENPGFLVTTSGETPRLELGGSYPPGQKDIRLSFRIPSENHATETFRLGVPPNVAELRVLADHVPGLELRVAGFEPVQQAEGPAGNQVLITRWMTPSGSPGPTDVTIELFGLPTVGPERWYAVLLALTLAGAGLGAAWVSHRRGPTRDERRDRNRARKLLLDDLILLQRAHEQGEIGPETYDLTRRQLLVALARLENPKTAALSTS